MQTQMIVHHQPSNIALRRLHCPPRPVRRLVRLSQPKAIVSPEFMETTRIVGKGLTLFVLFASTLNWWYFRRTREDVEDTQKKDRDRPKK